MRYVNRVSKSVKMGEKGYVFCFRALSRKKGRFENVPLILSCAGEKSILAHKMPKFSSSLALLARIHAYTQHTYARTQSIAKSEGTSSI